MVPGTTRSPETQSVTARGVMSTRLANSTWEMPNSARASLSSRPSMPMRSRDSERSVNHKVLFQIEQCVLRQLDLAQPLHQEIVGGDRLGVAVRVVRRDAAR